MFCRVDKVGWMLLILFLSTKLRQSESLKDNNAEIRKRVKRQEADSANSAEAQIDARNVQETQYKDSQNTEESLEFEAAQGAFIEASEKLSSQDTLDEELIKQNKGRDKTSPEFEHFLLLRSKPEAISISRIALTQEFAALSASKSEGSAEVSKKISNTIVSSFIKCPLERTCNSTDDIYRSYDGSCNNKIKGKRSWGKTFTATRRLRIPPNYEDGISSPRLSVTKGPLPSARIISSQISPNIDKPNDKYTLSITQWGQFVDHDITRTPIAILTSIYGDTSIIRCCTDDGQHISTPAELHKECFPIDIPIDDPFYKNFKRRCMNFVRSLPAPPIDCKLGYRNQMNQNSHYLDASMVYGSSVEEASSLRTFKNGLLKVAFKNLLPENVTTTDRFDFIAGDSRVNEQPQLPIVHTLWLRQHNKVAVKLRALNPNWDDEKLYQVARRITGAQIQHVVYKEWLPIILGNDTMHFHNLVPKSSGYSTGYSTGRDASIINEFSTVAFRFGHTLAPGDVQLHGVAGPAGFVSLSENFFNSALVIGSTTFDQLLRGLFKQPMENFDQCLPDDLTNKLYMTNQPFGLDLVALNIQRGRDHGIGTYSQLRDYCRMRPVIDFSSLEDYIDKAIVAKLKTVYKDHVEDVDAFIAGIAEKPYEKGGILGPLFNCIVGEQFFHLKYGDRFFYENGGLPSSFTLGQLDEIRKTTWARIICDNSVGIKEVQPFAFKLPDSNSNAKVLCSNAKIPTVNLNLWKE